MSTVRSNLSAPLAGLALAASLLLSGCGFHLQGASPLPDGIDRMSVNYHDNYTVGDPELVTALRERLRRQHLLGEGDAPATLDIVSVEKNERTVAVSPVDGDAAVYELTARVVFNYSVRGADQIRGATLSTSQDYTTDATQRLSSDDERDHMLDQMQDDLAGLVLERIAQHNHGVAENTHSSSAEAPAGS